MFFLDFSMFFSRLIDFFFFFLNFSSFKSIILLFFKNRYFVFYRFLEFLIDTFSFVYSSIFDFFIDSSNFFLDYSIFFVFFSQFFVVFLSIIWLLCLFLSIFRYFSFFSIFLVGFFPYFCQCFLVGFFLTFANVFAILNTYLNSWVCSEFLYSKFFQYM